MQKVRKKITSILSLVLIMSMTLALSGCGDTFTENTAKKNALSRDDAMTEMKTLLNKVNVHKVEDPIMDIYSDDVSEVSALADIDTFPLTVTGSGKVDIEIAAPSEFSGEAPDDWINVVAKKFNNERYSVNGKSVSVSVRKISSGEAVTYINAGIYKPNAYVPSNYAFGMMLEASGVDIDQVTDRVAGNTAGVLIEKKVYDEFIEKYKEANIKNILEAANAGDIQFAYTNPYTSATGLNILTSMLAAFDPSDPLSEKAQDALLEYQKSSPPVAYTTGVLRNQAKKGLISAMVMEWQAYCNTPELKGYVYFPVGIRHDHPVYSFGWNDSDEDEAVKLFVNYMLSDSSQKIANEKGFNKEYNDYVSDDSGLTGTGYLSAQKIWKQNKSGGRPIIAVFIADVSGSMNGTPLVSLKNSLVASAQYISSDNYIGLVSYSDDVTINLPIEQFDEKQRAYYSGEIGSLIASGATATYDAILVGLNMIEEKMEEVPDATPMLFVLTDGDQNQGYSLNRITPIVGGLEVPIYSIAYNYENTSQLSTLSEINEATVVSGTSEDIVNQLRNLFNVEL